MTEFIFGQSRADKRAHVLSRIKEAVADGKRVIVIAPEQQALLWDTTVARELDATAALKVETLSFTRLADSIFRRFGGCAKNYITNSKKALLMWNAVLSVRDKLKVYGRGREDRFVPVMLQAVSEAKLYSQTPDHLLEIAEKLEAEGREAGLSCRLHDLALVWSAYETMLHASYDDPEEIPDALCDLLERVNVFDSTSVFIDSFYTLTPKEKNIVRRIMQGSGDVFVTFETSADDRDNIHTEHIREFKSSVAKLASRAGREFTVYDAGSGKSNEAIKYLSENLWKYSAKPFTGDTSVVSLLGCGDRHDEAAVCAARICQLVRDGAKYSEIAVIAAEMEKLGGILDTHLSAMGIPVYMAQKTDLCSQSAMRVLLSAAAVAAGGWRREDVLSLAKTGLTPLTPEECDALEKYTEKWRLRGKRAFCSEGWNMNPLGYTDRKTEWSEELLAIANDARDKLIPPLERFTRTLSGTVEAACRGAFELLCDFGVYSKICAETDRLRAAGEGAKAQERAQVWNAICGVLDTMVETSGPQTIDAARFAGLLRRTSEEVEIGTIPDGVDRVLLASVAGARLEGISHVIILGAMEGEFPRVPTDNGFFGERDKEVLLSFGIELSPGMDMRRSEELFRFYSAVSAPTETLTVIIPERDGEETRLPSLGVARIEKLLGIAVKKNTHLDYSFLIQNEAAARYYLPSLRKTEMGAALEKLLGEVDRASEKLSAESEFISRTLADELFGGRMVMSQSKFERFQNCPQSYYLRYVLKLDEGETAKIANVDVGNFVHKILENVLSEIKAEGNRYPFDEDKVGARARTLIDEYINKVMPEGSNERHKYLFDRISRSLLIYLRSLNREFSAAEFKPEAFELNVGLGDAPVPALEIPLDREGNVMAMCGVIDRVDTYRGEDNVYIRVADYKTGAKRFNLEKTLEGKNIQLLLYLFSICSAEKSAFRDKIAPSGENLIPAGAVYFSALPGQVSAEKKISGAAAEELTIDEISRTGLSLAEEAIIRAMDPEMTGRYSPAKLSKKDGKPNASAKTREEMDEIKAALESVMRDVGLKMKTGIASACPDAGSDPCGYCKMKAVCRIERGREEETHGENTVE